MEPEDFEDGVISSNFLGPTTYEDLHKWPQFFREAFNSFAPVCFGEMPANVYVTSKWSGIGTEWLASQAPKH